MKVILATLLLVVVATALPLEQEEAPSGWLVPQPNGTLKFVSQKEWKKIEKNYELSDSTEADVIFNLYTRENAKDPQSLETENVASIKKSNFNPKNPTRFVTHGWMSSADSDVCYLIRDALLAVGKFNVICVDWSAKALTINYIAAKLRVAGVGKKVAQMIDFLNKNGDMSFESLHLIGHSLGAHVSGYAGKNVKNGKIQQITGLDPALPLFNYDDFETRLNKDDASYVESIQTCAGLLGFLRPIGKSAFYPNGGKRQPGCGIDLVGSCAHGRSIQYYAEAIYENKFATVKCSDYEKAVDNSCGTTYTSVLMGAPTNFINAKGCFFVPVNKKSPFGKIQ